MSDFDGVIKAVIEDDRFRCDHPYNIDCPDCVGRETLQRYETTIVIDQCRGKPHSKMGEAIKAGYAEYFEKKFDELWYEIVAGCRSMNRNLPCSKCGADAIHVPCAYPEACTAETPEYTAAASGSRGPL